MLETYPVDRIRPGDVLMTNDPWISAGHLPDLFLFTPFFYDGKLLAFLVTVAHHLDVGGKNPGSTTPDTTDIFQEGIQIPIVKLYGEGRRNEALFRMVLQNIRLPEVVSTDIQGQMAVNERGRVRFARACREVRAGDAGLGVRGDHRAVGGPDPRRDRPDARRHVQRRGLDRRRRH